MGTHPITREENVREAIAEMRETPDIEEGQFSSLGMLIADSTLFLDEVALRAAHDGLRRLYGQFSRRGKVTDRGRILGLIDVTYWALLRVG